MITVLNLNKTFNGQKVLENINIDIPEGQLLAIMGESGSGKSVLLQHMIGIFKPDSGTITVDGRNIVDLSEKELLKVRKDIGYLFQEGALYDFMTVYDNVAFPLREHTRMKESEVRDKVTTCLKIVGLKEAMGKLPSELSGGMKKRAALARAVIMDSSILLCDEPTSGLDPIRSRDICDMIHEISRKLNCTTVITSHDVPNAFRIADHVVILRDGSVVARGTPRDIRNNQDPFVREFLTVTEAADAEERNH